MKFTEMGFFGHVGLVADCILTIAVVFAHWPQILTMWKVTKSARPSLEDQGFSSWYAWSYALFTGFLLSHMILVGGLSEIGKHGSLANASISLILLPFLLLWLCAMAMMLLSLVGQTLGARIMSALVLGIHAYFYIYTAFDITVSPSYMSDFLGGILAMTGVLGTSFLIPLMGYAQHSELCEGENRRAFHLPSFFLQSAVMAAMGIRWAVAVGIPGVESKETVWGYLVKFCIVHYLAINFFGWVVAALFVYRYAIARPAQKKENEEVIRLE